MLASGGFRATFGHARKGLLWGWVWDGRFQSHIHAVVYAALARGWRANTFAVTEAILRDRLGGQGYD